MAYVPMGQRAERASPATRASEWARAALRVWRNRRAVAQLASLDDRLLADIGLTRGDVDHVLGLPLGEDPSLELARIAAERRRARRAAGEPALGQPASKFASVAPPVGLFLPPREE